MTAATQPIVVTTPGTEGAAELRRQAESMALEWFSDERGQARLMRTFGCLGRFGEWSEVRDRPRRRAYAEAVLWRRMAIVVRAALLAGMRFEVRWGGIREVPHPDGRPKRGCVCLQSELELVAAPE